MSEEEQEAIEYIKAFQKDLYGASEKNLMAIYIDRVWNYIDKLQKENKEWFDIADNILRATNKYGEISIGEVADYIDKLQKEIKELEDNIDFIDMTNDRLIKELENSIPKTIIRNKIKELEDKKEQYSEQPLIYHILKNQLEELLEG